MDKPVEVEDEEDEDIDISKFRSHVIIYPFFYPFLNILHSLLF